MSIKIYNDTKIYINAPAGTATGGPELLHQLCFHLRNNLSIKAYMFYTPTNHICPLHPVYKYYNNPFVREIEDNEKNLLIVPEVIQGVTMLSNYRKINKIIWWLSVDNFFLSKIFSSKKNLFTYKALNKVFKFIFKNQLFDVQEIAYKKYLYEKKNMIDFLRNYPFAHLADYHLAQSFYAKDFLEKAGIKKSIYYLSDYLNKDFLKIKTDPALKRDVVVYNPKKGFYFTKKIIRFTSNIKFIPITNMTRQEVIKTLKEAKVYIDFGNHPGKDRIPREAAILGCCVITGKRGSAKYFEDIPIPEEYKFEDKEENIPKIIVKIRECLENFENRYKDFEYYRQIIKNEPKKFIKDLKKIFIRGGTITLPCPAPLRGRTRSEGRDIINYSTKEG